MAFIPTRHTYWALPRGAGRVEEMEGFSPPDRRVAPPPGASRFDLLIHVDRVEDWSPRSPRSSHSAQSGLPSSDSDNDDDALLHIFPGTWAMHVEDGQREERHRRQARAPVADTGCRGMPMGGPHRDHDSDGGGNKRSWRDALGPWLQHLCTGWLGRGCAQGTPSAQPLATCTSPLQQLQGPAAQWCSFGC